MAEVTEAKIKEVIQRTCAVKSFRLDVARRRDFLAGQFLRVWLKEGDEFKRYLSISSSPTEKDYIEFTKKLTQSSFSRLLDTLVAGDRVKIEYPFGNFVLDNETRKIAFISGGIGITPIRSICKYAVDTNLDIDMILLYGNRSAEDIVFKEDFDLMQKVFSRLRVVHVLCERKLGFFCREGWIDLMTIKEEVADYAERKFYLCGPPAMVKTMQDILVKQLGVESGRVVTENFKGY
ncbi:MAG: FAD-dependent oxidoreductase [Candidatus Omnitrophica bacterium]|nr:FAD-dependent oxidoreductase [Candidatus Omnitrophota bacterium]